MLLIVHNDGILGNAAYNTGPLIFIFKTINDFKR